MDGPAPVGHRQPGILSGQGGSMRTSAERDFRAHGPAPVEDRQPGILNGQGGSMRTSSERDFRAQCMQTRFMSQ